MITQKLTNLQTQKLIWVVVCVLFLSGCSREDSPGVSVDANYPILPSACMEGLPVPSRGTGSISSGASFAVSVFRVDQTGGSYPSDYADVLPLPGEVENDRMTIDPVQYYQTNGAKTRLVGIYPAVGAGSGTWNATSGSVSYTLDGTTDVMVTHPGEGDKDSAQPTLQFRHLLSQAQVFIYAEDPVAIDVWGDILSVAITGQQPTCVVTLPAPGSDAAATAVFEGIPAAFAVTDLDGTPADVLTISAISKATAQRLGYSLIAPTASAIPLELEVTTEKGGMVPVTLSVASYLAGKASAIYLKLTATEIRFEGCTIADWIEGNLSGSGDTPIEIEVNDYE